MQLQNDRIYRKAYHDSKSQVHIPVDAMSVQAAKDCQALVSDIDYRQYLHQWTCLPDQNDVIHARKAYDLQSDVRMCRDVVVTAVDIQYITARF